MLYFHHVSTMILSLEVPHRGYPVAQWKKTYYTFCYVYLYPPSPQPLSQRACRETGMLIVAAGLDPLVLNRVLAQHTQTGGSNYGALYHIGAVDSTAGL